MPSDVTIADIYEKTAEVLETEGWIRGSYNNYFGYCAVGGMKQAARLLGLQTGPRNYIGDKDPSVLHLAHSRFRSYLNIPDIIVWNDAMSRHEHEVIDTFKQIAKDIRNGEFE